MNKGCTKIVALLIWITGCTDGIQKKSESPDKFVREIDKIRLTDMSGTSISLKQFEGKTIFINFWATWCKPCIKEMPSIKEAQNILKNEEVIFLMASNESAAQIEEFKKNHEYSFDYLRIENSEEMNVQTLPVTFIFNSKGNLVFSEAGFRKWDDKNNIDMILKIMKEND